MPASESKIATKVPNKRFGLTALNIEHRDMAAKDEILINKVTGEFSYKRKSDGRIVTYGQENNPLYDYLLQFKSLEDENRSYIKPSKSSDSYNATFFLSTNFLLREFEFPVGGASTFLTGGLFCNVSNTEFTISRSQNGFFTTLIGNPRERSIVSLLNDAYNEYYRNYDGTDESCIAIKKLIKNNKFFEVSQAVVNYTVRFYTETGDIYKEYTDDGYVRLNEMTYIPFPQASIMPEEYSYRVTLTINYISTPKLAKGMELISGVKKDIFDQLRETEDLHFSICNVGVFVDTSMNLFTMPNPFNTTTISFMSMVEFSRQVDEINLGGNGGIVMDVDEPDDKTWIKNTMWIEVLNYIYSGGEVEDAGAKTNIHELEMYFTNIKEIHGRLSVSITDPTGYYVLELGAKPQSKKLPW